MISMNELIMNSAEIFVLSQVSQGVFSHETQNE